MVVGAGRARPVAAVVGTVAAAAVVVVAGLRLPLVRLTLVTAAWLPLDTAPDPPASPPSPRRAESKNQNS